MTQYTKPTVLPAWAESAGGADVLQPSNAEIQAGWPLSNVPPSRKRFNWVLKYLAQGVRYLLQRGIPEWDAAEDYRVNDRVQGSNGKTYRCIQAGINQNPTTQTAYWALWGSDGRDDQLQLTTAFTTAGTAPNFTLTPVPAPTALTANLRFRVKFHAAGAGSDVINIAGLGNKSVKQYDSTGAKVAAVIAASQLADVEYDGVDMVVMDALPSVSSQGNFAGLASTNASTVLASADMGKLYAFYGSTPAQTLTLPPVATISQGRNAIIVNHGSVAVTVKANAAENISSNTAGAGQTLSNTIILNPGDSIILSSNGANQWNAYGFASPGQFPNSLAANGYQKLPNGLILQWGTVATPAANSLTAVTFPIAFPTACRFVGISGVAGAVANSSSDGGAYPSSFTTTGFTLGNYWDSGISPATQYWFAIGH